MKTAKEMFEELGFTSIKYNKKFLEYENSDDEIIYFDKIEKYYSSYCCNNEHDFDVYTDDAIIINMKLHKAINKQIEELGWED